MCNEKKKIIIRQAAHLKMNFFVKISQSKVFKKVFLNDYTTRRVLFLPLETFDGITCCLQF